MAISGVMMKANMKGRCIDRDEDLTLFKELQKHHNEHISSFFHCVNSQEFECDTNYTDSGIFSLFRIHSWKKEHGFESLETNKNDYDWLKTPPATPLFPSLEMEPSPQLVVQKELPISQPISRFAKSDVVAPKAKTIEGKTNQTNSNKAKLPLRSMTPSQNRQRPSIIKNTNEQQTSTTTITNKSNINTKIENEAAINSTKSTLQKQTNNVDFLALNMKKSIETNESQRKPRARGVSPSVRPRVVHVSNIMELSNETPSNLRTDLRSSSTARGRSAIRSSSIPGLQIQDPTPRTYRPSRSPSPSMVNGGRNQLDKTQKCLKTKKETFTLAASTTSESRAHFKGSKMVEKIVNARKSGVNPTDREVKTKSLKYREK